MRVEYAATFRRQVLNTAQFQDSQGLTKGIVVY